MKIHWKNIFAWIPGKLPREIKVEITADMCKERPFHDHMSCPLAKFMQMKLDMPVEVTSWQVIDRGPNDKIRVLYELDQHFGLYEFMQVQATNKPFITTARLKLIE